MPSGLSSDFPGASAAIERLRHAIGGVLASRTSVLLVGEPGTGKSFTARWIYDRSESRGQFVEVNCDAEAADIRRGRTDDGLTDLDAVLLRLRGVVDSAAGGTLVLDNIDELPTRATRVVFSTLAQPDSEGPKLFRDRRGGDIKRAGSDPKPARLREDTRLIATSANRLEFTGTRASNEFLRRTNAVVIDLPPLRERLDDIPTLVAMFRNQIASSLGIEPPTFQPAALKELATYDFPANLLELQGLVRRLTLAASNGQVGKSDVAHVLQRPQPGVGTAKVTAAALKRRLEATVQELEYLRHSSIAAKPIWEGRHFEVEDDYCFILMPFREDGDIQRVYRNHVKPVIERKFRLRCERADDIYGITGVMQSVWEGINRARIVLAELTGRNANVFYELGIAHTLGKPVVMMSQDINDVPADLRHLRCIIYGYKPEEIVRFEAALEKTVASALAMTAQPGRTVPR